MAGGTDVSVGMRIPSVSHLLALGVRAVLARLHLLGVVGATFMVVQAGGGAAAAGVRSHVSSRRADSAGGVPSRATGARVCGPARAKTLAADRVARIYSSHGVVSGCSAKGARSYRLGSNARFPHQSVGPLALSGDMAAYVLGTMGVDTNSDELIVRRLTDGKEIRDILLSAVSAPRGGFVEGVDSIVVKSNGSVAWIGDGGPLGSHLIREVVKADRHGKRRLDHGNTINARSLRLHGSTLSWKHGGVRRTATLS